MTRRRFLMAGADWSRCRQSDETRFGLWVINVLIMLINLEVLVSLIGPSKTI